MTITIPKWADEELSAALSDILVEGEGTKIEFKESFPEQAHKLAKELAALATSGGGDLFIGINDNNELVGIDAGSGEARDEAIERAQGITEKVRPDLTAEVLFAVESGIVALAIRIPKQDEPVYYYDGRPYIRDGRRSRPARPNEVKARVWSHPSSEFKREQERLKLQQEKDSHENLQRLLRK